MDVVLDTNVVLDLFVFRDPAVQAVREGLSQGRLRWIATHAMRAECERVLAYPLLQRQLAARGAAFLDVLQAFDAHAALRARPAPAPVRCADADDQMFIDLAVAHAAQLLSRDREVLRLRKRLADLGVAVDRPRPPA